MNLGQPCKDSLPSGMLAMKALLCLFAATAALAVFPVDDILLQCKGEQALRMHVAQRSHVLHPCRQHDVTATSSHIHALLSSLHAACCAALQARLCRSRFTSTWPTLATMLCTATQLPGQLQSLLTPLSSLETALTS
jgi:hypothetical protein